MIVGYVDDARSIAPTLGPPSPLCRSSTDRAADSSRCKSSRVMGLGLPRPTRRVCRRRAATEAARRMPASRSRTGTQVRAAARHGLSNEERRSITRTPLGPRTRRPTDASGDGRGRMASKKLKYPRCPSTSTRARRLRLRPGPTAKDQKDAAQGQHRPRSPRREGPGHERDLRIVKIE